MDTIRLFITALLVLMAATVHSQVSDVVAIPIRDIDPGPSASFPTDITRSGDRLFFFATCNDYPGLGDIGTELWVTDGTEEGTDLVRDINPGPDDSRGFSVEMAPYQNGVVFSADDGVHGIEPWFSDGTALGTVMLSDTRAGMQPGLPASFRVIGDTVHFASAVGVTTTTSVVRWWVTEGTPETTREFLDSNEIDLRGVGFFAELPDGKIASTGIIDGILNSELWSSDGTAAGTNLVKEINPTGSGSPFDMTRIGDLVYFSAMTSASGREPYVTDGTASGTLMLADIRPGSGSSAFFSAEPYQGETIFYASPAPGQATFYVSDGTPAGTRDLFEGFAQRPSNVRYWLNDDPVFIFTGFSTDSGNELWRTDGTESGTYLIKDLLADGFGALSAAYLGTPLEYMGQYYFVANDGQGNQIWRTTGEQGNAEKVTDHFSQLTFFDRAGSDGKETVKGGGPVPPGLYAVLGDRLIITAQTEDAGYELFALVPGNAAKQWSVWE